MKKKLEKFKKFVMHELFIGLLTDKVNKKLDFEKYCLEHYTVDINKIYEIIIPIIKAMNPTIKFSIIFNLIISFILQPTAFKIPISFLSFELIIEYL